LEPEIAWTSGPVLVIEDHEDSRHMICDFFATVGIPCVTAADGRDALAALIAHRPSLILLDLMMPEMDGVAFRENNYESIIRTLRRFQPSSLAHALTIRPTR